MAARLTAVSYRTCVGANRLYTKPASDQNIRTAVDSRAEHYYDFTQITDVIVIRGVRINYCCYYSLSAQTSSGNPVPSATPYYGWNQWSDNSYNSGEFSDWAGYHHRQAASLNGYGDGTCWTEFAYQGLLGFDEEYTFNTYAF